MTSEPLPIVSNAGELRVQAEGRAAGLGKIIFWSLLLVVITALPYLQLARQNFCNYDDDRLIYANYFIKNGITAEGLKYDWGIDGGSQWHPLAWFSHQVDCQLFGLWAGGHKIDSLIWHLCNAVLLFNVLRVITGRWWPAFLLAGVWGVHPMRVEVVAWVAERREVMSTFFGLWTILAYYYYARRPKWWRYALTFLLFCMALMSKPMLTTMPCLLLLLDYWPLRRIDRFWTREERKRLIRLILEKLPFFVPAFLSCYLTMLAVYKSNAISDLAYWTPTFRVATAIVAYGWYLWTTFFPTDLTVFYPLNGGGSYPLLCLSIVVLVVLSALAVKYFRRVPYFTVGWFFFLGTLVPVIGLVQVGSQRYADRYTYFPSIGLLVILFWGLTDLLERYPIKRTVIVASYTAIILVLTVTTWLQAGYWLNSVTLWTRCLDINEDNPTAHLNLGIAYTAQKNFAMAEFHYRETIRLAPNIYQGWNNMGNLYMREHYYVTAAQYFRTAIRCDPTAPATFNNLGAALGHLGREKFALNAFRHSLELDPTYGHGYQNMAMLLDSLSKTKESIPYYARGVELLDKDPLLRTFYASALIRLGQKEKGLAQLDQTLRDTPDFFLAVKIKNEVRDGLPVDKCPSYNEADTTSEQTATTVNGAVILPQR